MGRSVSALRGWSNDDEVFLLRRRTGVGGVDVLGSIDFELRVPQSAADRADLAMRRGVDHLYAGRFDAAEEELSRVLSTSPQSSIAL